MKNYGKKSVPFLLATLLLVGLAGCEPKVEDKREEVPVDPPKQIVTIGEAKNYYDNYSKRRVPLIRRYEDSINRRGIDEKMQQMQQEDDQGKGEAAEAPAKFDVARYVYYDYQTIKDYMTFIEQQAAAAKVDISTIRFYFSNYPDSTQYVHPRQNSIMISPALKQGDREYLFYIDDSDPENPKPVLLGDNFGPVKQGVGKVETSKDKAYASFGPSLPTSNIALVLPYDGGQSLTLNRGTGAPPPYHEQ
ncbi:hypothetical protein FK220_001315 [Flavobacteriaceae bacterium TP-CH-4]|uniref:Lipoprotein n=1 Tax=Pelagihabitans pacificus TaxID=2696054 RepID=A0A967E8X8_9FLAO|nr:hypothetical protein [Pelagihabitans pacificus]NHF57961.1 hypothetical protein [Pelagihabitans pacificus]